MAARGLMTMEGPSSKVEASKATGEAERRGSIATEVRLFSACLAVGVFALAVSLEDRDDAEAARLKLGAMLLASAWAGPLTVLAGLHLHAETWRVLQPFSGGFGFVVLQALGWMLYALTAFCVVVSIANAPMLAHANLPRGAYAALGGLAAASQLTLNYSLSVYDGTRAAWHCCPESVSAPLAVLAALLGITGQTLCFLADALVRHRFKTFEESLSAASSALLICGTTAHVLAAIVTHCVHGKLVHGARYRAWMPFDGGAVFVLLHTLSWTMFGIIVDVLVAAHPAAVVGVAGAPTLIGLLGIVANAVLIISLSCFSPRNDYSDRRIRGGVERGVALIFVVLAAVGFLVGGRRTYVDTTFPVLYMSALAVAHAAPPLAHLGALRETRGFRLVMVGRGGPIFIICQGCGWMLYSASALFSILTMVNGPSLIRAPAMCFHAPLAVLSAALLVASVGQFDEVADEYEDYDETPRGGPSEAPPLASPPVKKPTAWKIRMDAGALEFLTTRREACADLCALRSVAQTEAVKALLDAAAGALAKADGFFDERDHGALDFGDDWRRLEEVLAQPRRSPASKTRRISPALNLAPDLLSDNGIVFSRWHVCLRRAGRDVAALLAAPLACTCGIVLFAGAAHVPKDSALPPILAMCAFAATLLSLPLHVLLDRRISRRRLLEEHSENRPRLVSLQLVALAAWSFSVLVALLALLDFSAGGGCALAFASGLGRNLKRSVDASPLLSTCGTAGVAMQVLALICQTDGFSQSKAQDSPITRELNVPKGPMSVLASWSRISRFGGQARLAPLLDAVPMDAWRSIEDHLDCLDLCRLAACARSQPVCAVYARPSKWRLLFLQRRPFFLQKRPARNFDERRRADGARGRRRRHVVVAATRLEAWTAGLWRNLVIALENPESYETATAEFCTAKRVEQCTEAFGWKFACCLRERGAPLVRCASCGEVDLGDACREFCAPCVKCGDSSLAHRACVERDCVERGSSESTATNEEDRCWGRLDAPLPVDRLGHRVGRCAACGVRHEPAARPLDSPAELWHVMLRCDWKRTLRNAARVASAWLVVMAFAARCEAKWNRGEEALRAPHWVFAWWAFQQLLLLKLFGSRRLSIAVSRLWAVGGKSLRFYFGLYLYFTMACGGVVLAFSPLRLVLRRLLFGGAETVFGRMIGLLLDAFAWTNFAAYAAVSSSTLYLFARSSYTLLTVKDHP